MDFGSGWLVTQSGVWVPVAYNATVDATYNWARTEFQSLMGKRRTATRGRTPRSWEVSEEVFYDWAQPLETLWQSEDSNVPMFWIPPLGFISNYAPPAPVTDASKRFLRKEGSGVGTGYASAGTGVLYVTDYFPVRAGLSFEYGGRAGSGKVGLSLYDANRKLLSTAKPDGNVDADGLTTATVSITNESAVYGRLYVPAGVTSIGDMFFRYKVDTYGVEKQGAGGCWVTLADVEVSNPPTSTINPMAKVSFTVTECELI